MGPAVKEFMVQGLAVMAIPVRAYGAPEAADNGAVSGAAVGAVNATLGLYALIHAWRRPCSCHAD